MNIDGKLSIAKLAADIPGATAIFEYLGIDYACAGERSLDDAAHAEGIAPETVIDSLRRLNVVESAESWHDRPVAELVRHLVTQHHHFVRDELAATALLLADVCTRPATVSPELLSLRAGFARLSELLLTHMHHEEENVFRTIEGLERAWQSDVPLVTAEGDLSARIRQLVLEHGAIAAQLHAMRELRLAVSHDLPPGAGPILDGLAALEAHFHEYMFLENSVLFPRALALEAQIQNSGVARHILL